MFSFGWQKKALQLRTVLLTAGHQMAAELHPSIAKTIDIFRDMATGGDSSRLQDEFDKLPPIDDASRPLWEPAEIYGWKFEATFYLKNGQLWWICRAARMNEKSPSDKDLAFLDKVLEVLGADPERNMIIGPRSGPPGHALLPFGWWTWCNRHPLLEMQVNKHKTNKKEMTRIVPHGTQPSDGYEALDLTRKPDDPIGA